MQLLITATREEKNLVKKLQLSKAYRNTSKATKILQEVYFFLSIEFDAINFESSVLQKGEKRLIRNFITSFSPMVFCFKNCCDLFCNKIVLG